MKRLLLSLLLHFGFLACSMAQNATFFTSKQGLVNSCVQSIYEDSRRNVWISTRSGLNRFDGVKMNSYRHIRNDESSLKNNFVLSVLEYDRNTILIGTDRGIQTYSYITNDFTDVPILGLDNDTMSVHVEQFARINDNEIVACFSGYGSLRIFKDESGHLLAKQTTDYLTGNSLSPVHIYKDRKGRVWVVNSDHKVFLREKNSFRQIQASNYSVNLCESTTGRLYLGDQNDGLYVYDEKSGKFSNVCPSTADFNLWCIRPWYEGRVFICSDGKGLKVYDENTGLITKSAFQINDFNLTSSNVKDALYDSYGNAWVGIYWKGILLKPSSYPLFEYVGRHSIGKNVIGTNSVTAITPSSDGRLWVATDHDGLYRMELDGKASSHWGPDQISHMPSTINAMTEDNKGTLWLGSYNEGLWSMNIATGTFVRSSHSISHIFDMAFDQNGILWIATLGGGFYSLDTKTGSIIDYTSSNQPLMKGKEFSPALYDYSIFRHGNRLYVGSTQGLEVYDCNGTTVKQVNHLLAKYNINTISEDSGSSDHLWLGTNNGLIHLNTKTFESNRFTEKDGLPSYVIQSIEPQGTNLWVATDNGLSCLDTQTKRFVNYYNEDGIQDNEFIQQVSATYKGKYYFGGISGLTYFDESDVTDPGDQKSLDTLRLTQLFISNRPVYSGDVSGNYSILSTNIDDAKEIHLAHSDNHFSVELAIPGGLFSHVVSEYNIDGKKWVENEGPRVMIQSLNSGYHKIKIRARVGHYTFPEREFTVVVHDPWYNSTFAWFIYFVILFALGIAVFYYIRQQMAARKILLRHRHERQMNETRIQFFMNISHEIRTPMTLIMAPLEKLISNDPDPDRQRNYNLIRQNGNRILRLVNQMLDIRKIEMGQFRLSLHRVDMVVIVQNAFDVFSSTAQQHQIEFSFLHQMPSLEAYVDTENFDKILINLLSNAFKFTPDGGKITVELTSSDPSSLSIIVTDSGIGIKDGDKPKVFERFYSSNQRNGYVGTGIGLNLTSLLVKLHKGTIKVLDNPDGQGSSFVVTLPANLKDTVPSSELALYDEPEPATATTDSESTDEAPGKPATATTSADFSLRHRHVILVDDEPSIREYVMTELSTDMIIEQFSNGQDAWDRIIKNPQKADLVISDVLMPVMGGLELCTKIRDNANTNHIPVILMSALNSDKDRIDGIKCGADAYVAKPFNIDVLHTTALTILRSRQLLQGKFMSQVKAEQELDKVELTSPDEQLMKRILKVINQNMDNSDLSVETFADLVGISRVHFYRKMKELTGQSPRDYLKYVRLQEAGRLLSKKHLDITEVSVATGFKSLSTFSTAFKALYGMTPSEWVKKHENEQATDTKCTPPDQNVTQ